MKASARIRREILTMTRSHCPHCRKKLRNYLYATECPFCRKELVHNRVPTELEQPPRSSETRAMWIGAIVGAGAYAVAKATGISVPGMEAGGLGSQALWFIILALGGAIVGRVLAVFLFLQARGKKDRRTAFLAQFPMPVPDPVSHQA